MNIILIKNCQNIFQNLFNLLGFILILVALAASVLPFVRSQSFERQYIL